MTIGLYHPGASLLHRMSAGPKLVLLLITVIAVTLVREPWQLGAAGAVTAGLFLLARIPIRVAVAQLWPLRWILLVIGGLQWWRADWRTAVLVAGGLLVTIALAALLTLTTRVTALLDLCVRLLGPVSRLRLGRLRIDPDRVGLVLALAIRCVPLLVTVIGEVQQARRARGVGFSLMAVAAPSVVRALRHADALGDALIARGVDD